MATTKIKFGEQLMAGEYLPVLSYLSLADAYLHEEAGDAQALEHFHAWVGLGALRALGWSMVGCDTCVEVDAERHTLGEQPQFWEILKICSVIQLHLV